MMGGAREGKKEAATRHCASTHDNAGMSDPHEISKLLVSELDLAVESLRREHGQH